MTYGAFRGCFGAGPGPDLVSSSRRRAEGPAGLLSSLSCRVCASGTKTGGTSKTSLPYDPRNHPSSRSPPWPQAQGWGRPSWCSPLQWHTSQEPGVVAPDSSWRGGGRGCLPVSGDGSGDCLSSSVRPITMAAAPQNLPRLPKVTRGGHPSTLSLQDTCPHLTRKAAVAWT